MADAKRIRPVVIEDNIQLTLTLDEANALQDIVQRIGGCPTRSRRKQVDSIARALRLVQIIGIGTHDLPRNGTVNGSLYFYDQI